MKPLRNKLKISGNNFLVAKSPDAPKSPKPVILLHLFSSYLDYNEFLYKLNNTKLIYYEAIIVLLILP